MTSPTHLRSLQALELAIRKGSIKAAAAELAITPAAVGQRIKALENYLGYELMHRGRSGIRAAEEMRQALAHLNAAFRELETVTRLLDFQRVDEIHLTADSDWAQLWLAPRLSKYREANPNVQFCVNGVGDVPMRLGDADCEVGKNIARPSAQTVMLYYDYILPVSSPVNSQRVASIPPDEMLEGFPLLHIDAYVFDADHIDWPAWVKRFGHRRTSPERGIHYEKVVQAMEAVYADAGFILCGASLILEQILEGRLSTPFPVAEGEWAKTAYEVRFKPASLSRGAVTHFRDWLLAEAEGTRLALDKFLVQ